MSNDKQLVTGVDFVMVPTDDVEASAEFYGTTLGLERSVYMPDSGFAEFETGNLTLSVISNKRMGREHTPNAHPVALHVEDIEEARATLEGRGVSFHADTLDTSVCHMAFFSDPDGNALMLHHRYKPRATED
jgi:predicted enzyme related to lactoylglutathione lyase